MVLMRVVAVKAMFGTGSDGGSVVGLSNGGNGCSVFSAGDNSAVGSDFGIGIGIGSGAGDAVGISSGGICAGGNGCVRSGVWCW